MEHPLRNRIYTAVTIGLLAAGLLLVIFYLVDSAIPVTEYEEFPGLINGEYQVDDGPWEPVDYETEIDDTFHRVTFRGFIHPRFLDNLELWIFMKNVWVSLRYADKDYAPGEYESGYDLENVPNPEDYSPGALTGIPGYIAFVGIRNGDDMKPLNLAGRSVILEVRRPYEIATERFSDCFRVGQGFYSGVYWEFFQHLLPGILLFVLVCFFGLFLFPVASFIMGRVNYRYLTFGAVCVTFGLYMIMQIAGRYLNLWFVDSVRVMTADRIIGYSFVIAILCYLKSGLKESFHRMLSGIVIAGLFLLILAFTICQLAGGIDLVASSVWIYPFILIAFLLMIVLLMRELRRLHRHSEKEGAGRTLPSGRRAGWRELLFLLSWLPLLITSMLDILDLFVNISGRLFFPWGLAITLIYQLISIIVDLRLQYLESIRYQKLQRELYEAEVSLMVSQIRPHFVYNTLSSIAVLCKLDPDTAYEATICFSDYLRGNMDALKQKEPAPFSKELDHIKKYLYIEKLRFQDRLNIVYDIQTEDFLLPTLSVQPLVENAVKHGIGKKKEGGTVTIATREREHTIEILISDDGVGFDTENKSDAAGFVPGNKSDAGAGFIPGNKSDASVGFVPGQTKKTDAGEPAPEVTRSHIGIENTRMRLKEMCGGTVTTESKPGEGTTVTISLPKS